jgi:signal transduction histidine kinase
MPSEPHPHPVGDGGTHTELFESFPHPLLAYARDDTSASGDDGAASGGDGEGADPSEETIVVRRVNPAFEAAFGIGADDIVGTPLDEVALAGRVRSGGEGTASTGGTGVSESERTDPEHDPDDPENHDPPDGPSTTVSSPTTTAASILERARDIETDVRFDWKGGGETRHFRVRAVASGPLEDAGYLVFADVTGPERERRDLEGRVEHLERVASVARHDIRNPLEVARIRLEAARDTGEDVHFEKVAGALDRIEDIARKVLATGGGRADPTDAVALGSVAEAAWETVDTADATLVTSSGLPTVRGDADQLRGLFENLFRNSVEHGAPEVTVTVEPLPDGFAVVDDGPGIPAEVRERAFEAGYSTAADNTGLGLSIVRRIAREHGWRVSLASSGESAANGQGGARLEFTGLERIEDESESSGSDEPGR